MVRLSFLCFSIKLHNLPISYLLISFSFLKYFTEIRFNSSISLSSISLSSLFKKVISEYPPELPLLTFPNRYLFNFSPSQQFSLNET